MSTSTKDRSDALGHNNDKSRGGTATSSKTAPSRTSTMPTDGTRAQSVNPQLSTALVHSPEAPQPATDELTTEYSPLPTPPYVVRDEYLTNH